MTLAAWMGTIPAMVVDARLIHTRLGRPARRSECGTVQDANCHYVSSWTWRCGCRAERIASSLLDMRYCRRHGGGTPPR